MCVYQLVTHGVCKCLLFISVGDLMSSSSSSQSSVGVYCVGYSSIGQARMLGILVFSLCGIPYLGIFFRKHLFFSYVIGGVYSWFLWFILLLGFGVSYRYSCRLLCMLFGVRIGLSLGFISQFKLIVYLVFIGCFIKYLGFCLLDEKVLLGSVRALRFLLVQVLGLITGGIMYFSALFCSGGLWNS